MTASQTSNSGGIGVGGVLTIVFVILKLTDTIDWSWWWVLSPLWIPVALVLAVIALGAIVVGSAAGLKAARA